MCFVQLTIGPTIISAGGGRLDDSDAYFIKRYVDKLKRTESLAWDALGRRRCEEYCAHDVRFDRRHFWIRLGDRVY